MTWAVVVPTVRAEKFAEFVRAWTPLFKKHDATVIVVQDAPDDIVPAGDYRRYHHGTIPHWIPRGTDMIRSWGIYQAWCLKADYTLSLDDDVLPDADIFAEYEAVFERGAPCSPFLDVGALTTYDGQLRGFPYKDRVKADVAVQYGGWDGVLDYDACTQLANPQQPQGFRRIAMAVPKGAAVTGCAMNMAWQTRYAQLMWQLPMLDGRFNRFGDIWAGLFAKKACDAEGLAVVVNGKATVTHCRASDPVANLEREAPGVRLNEALWSRLDCASYEAVTASAYRFFRKHDPRYAAYFRACRDEWLRLFR